MTRGLGRALWIAGALVAAWAVAPWARAGLGAEDFGSNQPVDGQSVAYSGAPTDWRSARSAHFRILYPSDGAALAEEVLAMAEEAAQDIGGRLGIPLGRETTWVLFPSSRSMSASNVPLDDLEEGIRAWTPLLRHRHVLTFEGSRSALEQDVRHAVTHVLHEQALYPAGAWSVFGVQPLFHVPDWLLEGMALYFAGSTEPSDEVILRGASLANRLLALRELADFNDASDLSLAYMEGLSATTFIVEGYGEDALGSVLRHLSGEPTRDLDAALRAALGVDLKELDSRWQRSVKKRYWPMIRDKQSPESVARALGSAVCADLSDAAWSPSGEVLACIAQAGGSARVLLVSAKDGARLRDATSRLRGQYDGIQTRGRALAWAPDGNHVMFIAHDHAALRLFVVDVVTGEARHTRALPLDDAFSPAFLPGGDAVLVGVGAGQADLYTYAFDTGAWRQLTHDAHLDDEPAVSGDGHQVLYVSERAGDTRLVRLDVEHGSEAVLLDGAGGIHSPQWDPSGKSIFFTADWTGTRDIYRLDEADGSVHRLTDLLAGAETPAVSPDGSDVAFSAADGRSETLFVLPMSRTVLVDVETPVDDHVNDVPERTAPTSGFDSHAAPTALLLDDLGFSFLTPADGIPRVGMTALASTWTGDTRVRLDVRPGWRGVPTTELSVDLVKPRRDLSLRLGQRTAFHRETPSPAVGSPTLIGERELRGALELIYPTSASRRATFELSVTRAPFRYRYSFLSESARPDARQTSVAGQLAIVQDRVVRYPGLGPVSGVRYRAAVTGTLGESDVRALSVSLDARRYFRLGARTVGATRLMLAGSNGRTPERFYLGGHTTLRATEYESVSGSRVGLASLELRVPLVNEVGVAWPVRITVRGVRGVLFTDVGIAWEKGTAPVVGRDTELGFELVDALYQYGIGLRTRVIGLNLRWDLARGHNLVRSTEWRSLVRVDHDF